MEKKKYKVSRWIFLSLSIIFNGFIIAYSCLSMEQTLKLNNFIRNIYVSIVNNATERVVPNIPITGLNVHLSSDKYNNIDGYQTNEIPLGSAKEITYSYLPNDATDTAVTFYTNNNDIVELNSSGTKVSVVGIKSGIATIYGKNKTTGITSSCEVAVIDVIAPINFEISLESTTVEIGSHATLLFDIDGGVLGHNELINSRYYDIRELEYSSSNESVATIADGVITPLSIGDTTITVSNVSTGFTREISINVVDGITPSPYEALHIGGPSICYDNDMLRDQQTGKDHYQLEVWDGSSKLDPYDFIWESSNELLVRVDQYGVMRGFRKGALEDEYAVITATSKITSQSVTYDVIVKEQLPRKMNFTIVNGRQTVANPSDYTACVGDKVNINISYDISISKKDVIATSSNESVIEITNQGSVLSLNLIQQGNVVITVSSIVNPELSFAVRIEVLKAGSITTNQLESVGFTVRKIVGHASLFFFAQIFTLITVYMFLYNKKPWFIISISLGISLFIASLSELIQKAIPQRSGSFKDVGIDFAGAVIGAAIVIFIFLIVKLIKNKKKKVVK